MMPISAGIQRKHFGRKFRSHSGGRLRTGRRHATPASSEDVALYRAIIDSGGRFRHSRQVRVQTSARMVGRPQQGGLD